MATMYQYMGNIDILRSIYRYIGVRYIGVYNDIFFRDIWVVLQKLPQLSDTHFSQVLNKLEKNFFMIS